MLVTKDTVKKFNALDVNVVDTTAAGDSFIAGLVVSLANNESIEKAIKYGTIVSNIVVTKKGAQSSIPNINEVNEFIRKMGDKI